MKRILFCLLLAACQKEAAPKPAPTTTDDKAAAAKARPVDVQGRRVDVLVSKAGYQPSKIEVKAGEQVTLVFTRVEDTKCGEELVIPALDFKKTLPLDEPVAVVFQRAEAGEVGFACGMDMMKGALVVQ